MPEPLSPRNAEVARLRDLVRNRGARHEAGRFVVEGHKFVAEASASDLDVYDVYVGPDLDLSNDIQAALDERGIDPVVVSERGIERIASTTSPQPIIAEARMPETAALSDAVRCVLAVVNLNDPGNLGTLARSAVASGFDAVACLGESVDPYARSDPGLGRGVVSVPVVIDRDVSAGLEALRSAGLTRFGTRMDDATPCDQADLTGPLAIVLGSEAHGLADSTPHIDSWLSIPMPGRTESLNVAMAGTILAYEASRQRRST